MAMATHGETRVNYIHPKSGSLNGGVTVTIGGTNFANSQFNFGPGKEKLGNTVRMFSDTHSYGCDIHKDGTHDNQITCHTRPMVAGDYYPRITVDGEPLPNSAYICGGNNYTNCRYQSTHVATPTIDSVIPTSAPPGGFVTIHGKIFTRFFDATEMGKNVTNGVPEKILRVYMGSMPCELLDSNGNLYLLALDEPTSKYGTLKCRVKSTLIGSMNHSVLIEGKYGRTQPAPHTLVLSSNDEIAMYEQYPDITEVSPSTGSTEGGTYLTISGKGLYDTTKSLPDVRVGGDVCTILPEESNDSMVVCLTQSQTPRTFFTGNRGIVLETWPNVTNMYRDNLTGIDTLTTSSDGYNSTVLTSLEVTINAPSVGKIEGYIEAPETDDFKLGLYGDGTCMSYWSDSGPANAVVVNPACDTLITRPMTKGQKYYIKVLFSTGHVPRSEQFRMVLWRFKAPFNEGYHKNAFNEKQTIRTDAASLPDIQTFDVTNWPNPDLSLTVAGVQTITVSSKSADETFRLKMFGCQTASLPSRIDAAGLQAALNDLSSIPAGEVTVTAAISGTTDDTNIIYTVTLGGDVGPWPKFELTLEGKTGDNSNLVQITSPGASSNTKYQLQYADFVSEPLLPTAAASEVQSAVTGLLSVRCPRFLLMPGTDAMSDDYEEGAHRSHQGGRVIQVDDPFCGRHVLVNPSYLWRGTSDSTRSTYKPINLKSRGYVCFAYKGLLQPNMYMRYLYTDGTPGPPKVRWVHFTRPFALDRKWHFECINLLSLAEGRDPNKVAYILDYLRVGKHHRAKEDVYIDTLYFASSSPANYADLEKQRGVPPVTLISATVTSSASRQYTVTMDPYDCTPVNMLTFRNEPSGPLSVVRTQAGSQPTGGFVDVSWNNATVAIGAQAKAHQVKDILDSIEQLGNVKVMVSQDTCHGKDWQIEWVSRPGKQPFIFNVDGSRLTGPSASVSVIRNVEGHTKYDPIPYYMLRTGHTTPQVTVGVNNIPARCSAASCDFSQSAAQTPTVTSISPTTGSMGDTVTVTGTGFDDQSKSNNILKVKKTSCIPTSATTTSFTCVLTDGDHGTYPAWVSVRGKGGATMSNGNINFTYTAKITGLDPADGGLGGGLNMTVNGTGLSDPTFTIKIGSEICSTLFQNVTTIVCRIPVSSSAGQQPVALYKEGSSLLVGGTFEYTAALTPYIDSASTTTGSPLGGEILTLDGTGLGLSPYRRRFIRIGNKQADIKQWSDTRVVLILPGLGNGDHPVQLYIRDKGYALLRSSGQLPNIQVDFATTSIEPRDVAMYGGRTFTITGSGFGNDSTPASILVGNTTCEITSISDTEVTCHLEKVARPHKVTNQGLGSDLTPGYGWDPAHITVERGDYIHWEWSSAGGVDAQSTPLYKVEQVDNSTAQVYTGSGFSSGTPSESGTFDREFAKPGVYHYWSGYLTQFNDTFLRGSVTVTERQATSAPLVFKIGDIEAQPVPASPSPTRRRRAASCVATPSSGCSVSTPNGATGIVLTNCYNSIVTAISPNQGISTTTINITGTGFGSDRNCVEVAIGGQKAIIQQLSDSSIQVTVDPSSPPALGMAHPVTVELLAEGYALISINSVASKTFQYRPSLTRISPQSGSLGGGTVITVTGSGFVGTSADVAVSIDGTNCRVQNVSLTQITCVTDLRTLDVTAALGVTIKNTPADTCPTASDCQFSFALGYTPQVSSISPSFVDGSSISTLTITGQNFHHPSGTQVITVTVGGEVCTVVVSSSTSTTISCTVTNLPIGANPVVVHVDSMGSSQASGGATVAGRAALRSVVPSQGSTEGKTMLTLSGNGFAKGVTVDIDGTACAVDAVSLSQITCLTAAHVAAVVDVTVTLGATTFPTVQYTYSAAATPTVTSISPTNGYAGATLTITGAGFSTTPAQNIITVGGIACTESTRSAIEVTCVLGLKAAGTYPVELVVSGSGKASGSHQFTYDIQFSSIAPSSGSYGGNQAVTLTGQGLSATASVTVCGNPCTVTAGSASQITCTTPAHPGTAAIQSCDVVVTYGTETKTLTGGYSYQLSLTAQITAVSPVRGGTGGGTSLTVTGSGFGTDRSAVSVTIDGSTCTVVSVSDAQVTCTTGAHRQNIKTKVTLQTGTNGIARYNANAPEYWYVDLWSSIYTWGGTNLPEEGDLVVVPKGMTLVLDMDTPILKMLLIQGGSLIFDEKDVELQAENILVTDGGLIQIGTAAKPFEHKAIITMHGQLRAPELPIYGAKTLAVRNGTLEFHGRPTPVTWTLLGQTASPGDTTLSLQRPVNWQVGDEIILASTGNYKSQHENEKFRITNVSPDGTILTLDGPLKHKHSGETQTFTGGIKLETRAEVGLLTHNIVFRGSNDKLWNSKIEACPAGSNPGQFSTQTCFQGRFGEEVGTDEFGACIMFHQSTMNAGLVHSHIEYIEMTYAGQAFRLGRYPFHFHLNGNMEGSYVRGCSIHHTFNRAVNIHNTHKLLVENNVVHDIMGGAIFLEDSIEENNIIQYNLAVFVKASSSLLVDDITPAAFWITHPNNIVRHNHVAASTHLGFWYRMHEHPIGPSYNVRICPRKAPLGEFFNNTVHSVGWYGLWIFEYYDPMEGGSCNSNVPAPAVFRKLTTWNSFRGAEWVECGAIQFVDFVVANNYMAGIEMYFIHRNVEKYTPKGAMVKNAVIISHMNGADHPPCTQTGLVLPFGNGLIINGTQFINFDGSSNDGKICSAVSTVKIICVCSHLACSGYNYKFANTTFVNSDHRARFEWEYQMELEDMDGSLTGMANSRIFHESPILPPTCTVAAKWSRPNHQAVICPGNSPTDVLRLSFNDPNPESLHFKNLIVTTQYGTSTAPYRLKSDTNPSGWTVLIPTGQVTTLEFEGMNHVNNFSYSGTLFGLERNDYVIIKHTKFQEESYDALQTISPMQPNKQYNVSQPPQYADINGAVYFDTVSKSIQYMVKDDPALAYRDQAIAMRAEKCLYAGCMLPVGGDLPVVSGRPSWARYWLETQSWDNTEHSPGTPADGVDVTIKSNQWLVMNKPHVKVGKLTLEGTLEFDHIPNTDGTFKNFILEADYIYLKGGRLLAGYGDHIFQGQLQIILQGNHASLDMPRDSGPAIGAKALAVFGGLDLHGVPHNVYWTQLRQTVLPGSVSLPLKEIVDWKSGDEIVITSTGYSAWETEKFNIKSVTSNGLGSTVEIDGTLTYTHLADTGSFTGHSGPVTYTIAAEVGLLTRNIRIIGGDRDGKRDSEAFGARVIVGVQTDASDTSNIINHKGFASFTNVEFAHTGQEGFTAAYDPRYSLSYFDLGDNMGKPSQVINCSFHDGYSPAIGVFGTNQLVVNNNVIHHTVGQAIVDYGTKNVWKRNLAVLSLFPGTFNNRHETLNIFHPAAMEVNKATNPILQENTVAGSERAGFRVDGEKCGSAATAESWYGNTAHSVLIGVYMNYDQEDCLIADKCSKLSKFSVYKAFGYGLYTQTVCSLELDDLTMVDNALSVFTMVLGPEAFLHHFDNKYVNINRGLFVGLSPSFNCTRDQMLARDDPSLEIGKTGTGFTAYGSGKVKKGRIAIGWPMFASKDNMAPEKSFHYAKKQNAMYGDIEIKYTTFAHYNKKCDNVYDHIIASNPSNPDAEQRIKVRSVRLDSSVAENSKVHLLRPHLRHASLGDCVDMTCDAKRKSYIWAMDGSFLGVNGYVHPDSAYQYNGDRRYGIGDDRIPKVMQTYLNGTKKPTTEIYEHTGIVGTSSSSCTFNDVWQAYRCVGSTSYATLITESMDSDFLTRRLSPVAVAGAGYLDFLSGPRAVGICHGYACLDRMSFFYAVLAIGEHYDIFFTSTSPQHVRLHLFNADNNQAVRVAIYMGQQFRYDVFYNSDIHNIKFTPDKYRRPINADDASGGRMTYRPPTTRGQYWPDISAGSSGDNYFDIDEKTLYVLVRGRGIIDLRLTPQIILSFTMPTITIDEFFNSKNLMSNLATFLKIPVNKIRIMKVVSEKSGRRRRQATGTGIDVVLQIGDHPEDQTTVVLDFQSLVTAASSLKAKGQANELSQILGAPVENFAIQDPVPATTDSSWADYVNRQSSGQDVDKLEPVYVPSNLIRVQTPVVSHEGQIFTVQPSLRVTDNMERTVTTLVAPDGSPWQISATLDTSEPYADDKAYLQGRTTVSVVRGWANFTDLGISHKGDGYKIIFKVIYPSGITLERHMSHITVPVRPLVGSLELSHDQVVSGEKFSVQVLIRDQITSQIIPDMGWKGHKWNGTLFLSRDIDQNAKLAGDFAMTFSSGSLTLTGLSLAGEPGRYILEASIVSDPPTYKVTMTKVMEISSGFVVNITAHNASVELRFNAKFDKVAANVDNFMIAVYNRLIQMTEKVDFHNWNAWEGSIYVNTTCHGEEEDVNRALDAVASVAKTGQAIRFGDSQIPFSPYMKVDGNIYKDMNGYVEKKEDNPKIVIIAVCVVVAVLLLVIIVVVVVIVKKKKSGKERTPGKIGGINNAYVREASTDKFNFIAPGMLYPSNELSKSSVSLGGEAGLTATGAAQKFGRAGTTTPATARSISVMDGQEGNMSPAPASLLAGLNEMHATRPSTQGSLRPESRSSAVSKQGIITSFKPRYSVDEGAGGHSIPTIQD